MCTLFINFIITLPLVPVFCDKKLCFSILFQNDLQQELNDFFVNADDGDDVVCPNWDVITCVSQYLFVITER